MKTQNNLFNGLKPKKKKKIKDKNSEHNDSEERSNE